MNNNCELDNGVYNKFMHSSKASLNFDDSNNDGLSDGLSGDSLKLSFDEKEKLLEHFDDQEIDHQVEEEVELGSQKRLKGEFSEFERITQDAESKLSFL